MVYEKQKRPAFIVAEDKVERFLQQKPDPEVREREKKLIDIFRKNNNKTRLF